MYRVTQEGKVINIDAYENVKHMRNILYKYNSDCANHKYSLNELREVVNSYIHKFVHSIPDRIITPITYRGEGIEILKIHLGCGYKDGIDALKKGGHSYWFYKDGIWSSSTHNSYGGYKTVTTREFLLKILNTRDKYVTESETHWECLNSRSGTEGHAITLTPVQQPTMTKLTQTINEAYFEDKKLAIQAARAVGILQGTIDKLDNLNAFIGKFQSRLNNIRGDINKSFESKDKDAFIVAIESHNALVKFLTDDNIWGEVLDLAEYFTEEPVEFDPEKYLTK